MEVPRPRAIGNQGVVKQLRSVLFSEVILGAASVRPKGYSWSVLSLALGWFGPLLSRRATDPLPPSILYLAITAADIRLFGKPSFSNLFEIGRWKKGSYRASHARRLRSRPNRTAHRSSRWRCGSRLPRRRRG